MLWDWHESPFDGCRGGLGAVVDFQFVQDVVYVRLHGPLGDGQHEADLTVGLPGDDLYENLLFAVSQIPEL